MAKTDWYFDARGRLLLERRGVPRDGFATDAYHFLRTATWTRIAVLFVTVYLVVNLIFASILWLGNARIVNGTGFADDFWFSVQTLGTIGYGALSPGDTLSNVVATIESLVGIVLIALITGLFFARFSTTSARVIFSKVAVVGDYDGKRTLSFRMANARVTAIVEATCRVYLSRDEHLTNGERVRRIHDLQLRRTTSPVFALSWAVYHVLDETSPLFGIDPASLRESSTNLIVTFQGIDDQLAANVHTRYAYNVDDIEFDRAFEDIIKNDPTTGARYLDFAMFDKTKPIVVAPASLAAS